MRHIRWLLIRPVARISLREGPQLRGAPRSGVPRYAYQKQKRLRIWSTIFSRGPFSFLVSYFSNFILFCFSARGGGARPFAPPPVGTCPPPARGGGRAPTRSGGAGVPPPLDTSLLLIQTPCSPAPAQAHDTCRAVAGQSDRRPSPPSPVASQARPTANGEVCQN